MVTEGFAPIMFCSPGFLRQNFARLLKLPQSQAINTTVPKAGGGGGGGRMLPCTPPLSYPSGIRKARLERKRQQLWINQLNSSAMTYSLYARVREKTSKLT